MLKTDMSLGSTNIQFGDPTFASGYDLKPVLEAGAGEDAKKAMKWFGGALALRPSVTVEGPVLAQSPQGKLAADQTTVLPGGESVKLTVTLDPRGYLDSWSCGTLPMGMFTPGVDSFSGGGTITEGTMPAVTTVSTWMFQRI